MSVGGPRVPAKRAGQHFGGTAGRFGKGGAATTPGPGSYDCAAGWIKPSFNITLG